MTPTDAPDPTPDGFCVCNGPAANGRMRDCGIAAHRAEAGAPEPTPAVKRGGRSLRERADAYVEALTLGGLDSMEADESVAASMLFAALDVEEMARAMRDAECTGRNHGTSACPDRHCRDDATLVRYRALATANRAALLGGAQ